MAIVLNPQKCSVCGKPATEAVNTYSGPASLYEHSPRHFQPRCADHGVFGQVVLIQKDRYEQLLAIEKSQEGNH